MNAEHKENDVEVKPDLTGQYAGNTILFVGQLLIIVGLLFAYHYEDLSIFAYGWLLVGIGTLIKQVRAIYLKLFE